MSAVRTAYRAGMNDWQGATLPTKETGWDTYQSRLLRYWFNQTYHDNTVYDTINAFSVQLKARKKLYKSTRGIYNPVARQNGIYVSKVYPGALDLDKLGTGAIPLMLGSDALRDALRNLYMWSNWGQGKNLYVRYGAKFGDSFIKVLDERDKRRVRLEVLDPRYVKYMETDAVGNITELHIEYERVDEERARPRVDVGVVNENDTYTYTEIITPDSFKTFKDGNPHGFYATPSGERVPEWENIYGFVPVTHAKHMDEGLMYGATAFNPYTSKIDELNDSASLLNDQIRKTINAMWYFAGVSGPTELDAKTTEKDEVPAIYGPADSQPFPMVATIDIEASLANINQMMGELEADMPELALHRMRQQVGSASGVAVASLYDDAASRITEAQSNYDAPLIRAMEMAISIGALGNYDNFQAFNPSAYANNDLGIMIKERPPLRDSLSKRERMDLLLQTGAPASGIWEELGYKKEKVKEWREELADSPYIQEAKISAQIEAANA